MIKDILLIAIFLFYSSSLLAQEKSAETFNYNCKEAAQFYDAGNYNKAIMSYLEIINVFNEDIHDTSFLRIYSNIASSFYLTGNFNKSIYYYTLCADIYDLKFDTLQQIQTYRRIGISYRKLKMYEKAEKFYSKGLAMAHKINSVKNVGNIYISLGNLYREKGNLQKARQFFLQSIQIGLRTKDTLNIAVNNVNFAELAYLSNDYDSVIYYLELSLKYQRSVDHKFLDSGTFLYFAKAYHKKGDYKLAEKYLNQTIEIETVSYSPKRLVTAYKLMSEIYQDQEKYEQANNFLQNYALLNDSILNEENKKNMLLYESLSKLEGIENENKVNKEKLYRNKIIYLSIGIAVFVLLFFMITLIKNQIKIKRYSKEILQKNILIHERNEEVSQQNEEISQQNEELFVHKENLQELVDEKTLELQNALVKAEESNRLKNSFLKNISHEVRTPMNAILGFAELLKYKEKDTNYEYIKIIDMQVHELLVLIDGIIKLSRLETEQIEPVYKDFSVSELFNNLYSSSLQLREKFKKEHISITFNEINTSKVQIRSDIEKIYTILLHLIENGLKYTETGSISIDSFIKQDHIIFKVKDTGIGIEKHKLDQIFISFYKIENSDKLYRGVGLGLAVVKKYTEILNGKISVDSQINKGTIFTVSIPKTNL